MKELLERFNNLIQLYNSNPELGLQLVKGLTWIESIKLLLYYKGKDEIKAWYSLKLNKDTFPWLNIIMLIVELNNPYEFIK